MEYKIKFDGDRWYLQVCDDLTGLEVFKIYAKNLAAVHKLYLDYQRGNDEYDYEHIKYDF